MIIILLLNYDGVSRCRDKKRAAKFADQTAHISNLTKGTNMDTISHCDLISSLPYVRQGKKRRKLWNPPVTGNYQFDYETGQRLARFHAKTQRSKGFSPAFTATVINEMPDQHTAVELGFLNELGEMAAA